VNALLNPDERIWAGDHKNQLYNLRRQPKKKTLIRFRFLALLKNRNDFWFEDIPAFYRRFEAQHEIAYA
jgi:hypothetical protein